MRKPRNRGGPSRCRRFWSGLRRRRRGPHVVRTAVADRAMPPHALGAVHDDGEVVRYVACRVGREMLWPLGGLFAERHLCIQWRVYSVAGDRRNRVVDHDPVDDVGEAASRHRLAVLWVFRRPFSARAVGRCPTIQQVPLRRYRCIGHSPSGDGTRIRPPRIPLGPATPSQRAWSQERPSPRIQARPLQAAGGV